jgi:predicted MFS family arabinose efflux permease
VQAGLALLPLPILISVGSPIMGQLAMRIGPRWPLAIGPLVVGAGMLLGLRIGIESDYWTQVMPAVAVMALGMAIAVAPLTSSVLGSVDQKHTGTASGFNSAVARIGGLIATALLGVVLSREGAGLIGGFHSALVASAIVCVAASVSALTLLANIKMREA